MIKAVRLIPEQFRRKGLATACLIPFTAVLNLLSVAVLFPLIYVVLDGGDTFRDSFLFTVMESLGFQDTGSFVLFLASATVVFILLKNLLTLCVQQFQTGYLLSLYRYFSTRAFSELFDRGLLFIRNSNTSELAYNVNQACYNFATGYFSQLISFLGDVLFCILMAVTLAVYDLMALLAVVGTFLPASLIYVFAVRSKMKFWGRREFLARREQVKTVQETFKGYAEMKVNGTFDAMNGRFETGLDEISRLRLKTGVLQSIPGRLMEVAITLVLAVLVLLNIDASDPSGRLFLGVFTVVMLRMMPAVLGIINTLNGMKNAEYSLDIVSDLAGGTPEEKRSHSREEPYPFGRSIQVEDLSFSFPDRPVFSHLSFEIARGERFGIRGRTGSGKSTLFNLLLGLIPPDEGRVLIDGHPLEGDFVRRWHSAVGYVSQDVFISDTTIAGNIALGLDEADIDAARMDDAIDRACLRPFIDSLPNGIYTTIGEAGSRISGGQRQRIGIARALYKGARVLFFDEATSSLDVRTESEINEEILKLSAQDSQLTIIIISHRPGSLEFCDRILDL